MYDISGESGIFSSLEHVSIPYIFCNVYNIQILKICDL